MIYPPHVSGHVREMAMHEVHELKKHKVPFLAAAVLSIAAHCITGAVLMTLGRERPVVRSRQSIMVDIRNTPPAEKNNRAPVFRPGRKTAARQTPEKVGEVLRKRLPVLQPVTPAGSEPDATAASSAGSRPVGETTAPLPTASLPAGQSRNALPLKDRRMTVRTDRDASVPAAAAYLAHLREQIDRQKHYPATARRGRLQGTVRLRCALARSGELIHVVITGTSGYEILDNAAIRAVRGTGRFPEVPAGIDGETLVFDVPVIFRLAAD